jgi:hypothetical protein
MALPNPPAAPVTSAIRFGVRPIFRPSLPAPRALDIDHPWLGIVGAAPRLSTLSPASFVAPRAKIDAGACVLARAHDEIRALGKLRSRTPRRRTVDSPLHSGSASAIEEERTMAGGVIHPSWLAGDGPPAAAGRAAA